MQRDLSDLIARVEHDSRAGVYDYCAECGQKFMLGEQRIIIGQRAYHNLDCCPALRALQSQEPSHD